MPTDNILPDNAAFLQTLITSFTEHPEALKTLLENKPINDALAAYLNAAAERLRPETKWKMIYTIRGKERRCRKLNYSHFPGEPNEVIVVPVMELHYDEQVKVAFIVGGMTEAEPNFAMDRGLRIKERMFRRVELFDDPAAAIEWAQRLFPDIEMLVFSETTPIAEAAQNVDHSDA